jgi:hypothetical protein
MVATMCCFVRAHYGSGEDAVLLLHPLKARGVEDGAMEQKSIAVNTLSLRKRRGI